MLAREDPARAEVCEASRGPPAGCDGRRRVRVLPARVPDLGCRHDEHAPRAVRDRPAAVRAAPAGRPRAARRTYELDRAHVFHSWSAQAALDPLVVAGGRGLAGSGTATATVPRLLRPAGQHQHRPPAPEGRRGDPGAGRAAAHGRAAARQRRALRGGPADRRAGAGRAPATSSSPTAAPTPIENAVRMARLHTGRRKVLSRYRSYHGNTTTAINLTGDPRRWPNDYGAEGVVHFFGPVPLPLGVPRRRREAGGVRARAGAPRADDRSSRGPRRSPRSSWRPSPAPPGSWSPPPGYLRRRPRDLRPLRHPLDRRRGDVRLRPRRRVVRRRASWRRSPSPTWSPSPRA